MISVDTSRHMPRSGDGVTLQLVSGFVQLEVVYGQLGRRVVLSSDASCDDGAEHTVYVEKSFDTKQFTLRVDGAEKTVSLVFVAGERDVLNTKVLIIKLRESINNCFSAPRTPLSTWVAPPGPPWACTAASAGWPPATPCPPARAARSTLGDKGKYFSSDC